MRKDDAWTKNRVFAIKGMILQGYKLQKIADAFNVSRQAIHCTINSHQSLLTLWKNPKIINNKKITARTNSIKYKIRNEHYNKKYSMSLLEYEKLSSKEKELLEKKVYLFRRKNHNAKRKGIPFNLKFEDIIWPTHCPVLNIKLDYNVKKHWGYNSPSFDRHYPHKGYTKGNVYIISARANSLKNNGSFAEIKALYLYMKQKQKRTKFLFRFAKTVLT